MATIDDKITIKTYLKILQSNKSKDGTNSSYVL